MHVYQPITKCKRSGQVIAWFALRGVLAAPGLVEQRQTKQERRFLSQCLTQSESEAFKSFLNRSPGLSFEIIELQEIDVLLEFGGGFTFERLDAFEGVRLADFSDCDLPWEIVGRVLEGGTR